MFDDIPRPTCRSVYTSKESEALPLVNPFGDPYQNLDKPAPAPVAKKPGYDTYWHTAIMRWVVVGMIGFLTGLVAFLLDFGMSALLRSKFSVFNQVLESYLPQGTLIYPFLVLLAFNILFTLVSAIVTVIEPMSGGSGVPEIKCYLNGVKIPRVARVGTLFSKAIGVLFSVSAGFFVGQEGPMVYIGSVIGAGLPQLRSLLPCVKKFVFPYPYFRLDRLRLTPETQPVENTTLTVFTGPGTLCSNECGFVK
eukprot:Em0008g454a